MTLNPFLMGTDKHLGCFDENSPCKLEQTSICVISVTEKADADAQYPGQSKYVPWLVCMDGKGKDNIAKCNSENSVDSAAVTDCVKSDTTLVEKYLKIDKPIQATPTVNINGKNVNPTYKAIHKAICKEDPSLKGCSAPMPDWAGLKPEVDQVPTVIV